MGALIFVGVFFAGLVILSGICECTTVGQKITNCLASWVFGID